MSYIKEIFRDIQVLDSPNMVESIVLGDNFLYMRTHDIDSGAKALLIPFEPELIDLSSGEHPLFFLNQRVYGCLENLFISDTWSGYSALEIYLQRAKSGEIRLEYFESLSSDLALDVATYLDEGGTPNSMGYSPIVSHEKFSIYPLQPEHYTWDAVTGKDYFEGLERQWLLSQEEEEVVSLEEEPIDEQVEDTPEEVTSSHSKKRELTQEDQIAIRSYRTMYASAVNTILYNYGLMFTAAYQLKRPYGIATIENGRPNIVTIRGTSREYTSMDGILMHSPIIRQTINASGLKVCETRNAWDIAQLVLTGRTLDGSETASTNDRLYFPNKMLEFAYGLETPKATEGGRTNYPRHSDAESWEKYSAVVRKSLEQVMEILVVSVVRNKKEEGILELDDPEIKNTITEAIERIKSAFLTCVMVAEVVQIGGVLGLLKLKILDPYGLDVSKNIATSVAYEAYSMQDSVKSVSRRVVTDPGSEYYSVHTFEGDSKMVNAMPLFAYKAAESMIRAGRPILYSQMILGIDTNDNILQNGSGRVDMTPKITHYTVARSRAGKGVEGLSKLANAIKSGKPVFYLDNKPDMASMVLELCAEAFAVNGGNSQPGSDETGTNLQNFFLEGQYASWGRPELTPSFLTARNGGIFDSASPKVLANFYYLRAVLLIMSIIDSRVRIPSVANMPLFKDVNGQDTGLVAFFDEFNNLNDSLRSQLGSIYAKEFASMNYYLNEKKIAQARLTEEDDKKLPKQTQTAPSPAAYWATTLVDKLTSSAERISAGKNAGYGNGENSKTDIYVIGQKLPDIVDASTNLNQYYPERMATMNKAKRETLKPDYYPLAPLVAPFGQDILVGYSDENYLNQHNGFAKDKLNAQNRMFAYVSDFTQSTRDKILKGDEQFASSVPVYYKPFLILPSEDYKKYYVRNSMKFLDSSGLNVEEVIEQNAVVDSNDEVVYGEPYTIDFIGGGSAFIGSGVKLHSGVGLKGYLNYIGVSDEEIYANLKKSGDIAQEFMSLIGYKGTWREFIMDLRPEYMFSIDDIHESITTGVPLANITTSSSAEFYYVYPEHFTTSAAYDPESSDVSVDTGKGIDFGLAGLGEDEEDVPNSSYTYSNELNRNPEDLDEIDREDSLFDDINLGSDYDTYDNAQAIKFTSEERLKDLTLGEIASLPDEEKALIYKSLLEALEGKPVINNVNDEELGYGRLGVVHDDKGHTYKFDTSQVDLTSSEYDEIVLDNNMSQQSGSAAEISYSALVKTVTDKALATAKARGGIQSISVIGGSLVINEVMIGLRIAENLLQGLPSTVADDIRSGRLASYFNWKLLRRSRVTYLKVDSSRFIFTSISEGLGYNKNFNVQTMFEDIPTLQKFIAGNKEYLRRDVLSRDFTSENDDFYQPRRSEQAYRLSQAWLSRQRINSWQRSRDVWKRKDLGTFRKLASSLGNATLSATATTVQATGWTGRKLFRGIGKAAQDFKEMLDEANNLSKK